MPVRYRHAGLAQMHRNGARDALKHQRDPTKARAFDCATSFGCLFRLEPSEDINLNLLRMLNHPGVRRGAVIDGLVFASMLVVWSVIEWRSPGARNADTGAMALLGPVMFLLYLWLGAVLALGSSLLGAFAGYWAARTRNPFMGGCCRSLGRHRCGRPAGGLVPCQCGRGELGGKLVRQAQMAGTTRHHRRSHGRHDGVAATNIGKQTSDGILDDQRKVWADAGGRKLFNRWLTIKGYADQAAQRQARPPESFPARDISAWHCCASIRQFPLLVMLRSSMLSCIDKGLKRLSWAGEAHSGRVWHQASQRTHFQPF